MRFRLVLLVGALLGSTLWAPAVAASPRGDAPVTTAPVTTGPVTTGPVTTLGEQPEGGGIIPRPDSGVAPEDAGDRGGALQTLLFVIVVGGVVLIAGLVVRESRRARAERGF